MTVKEILEDRKMSYQEKSVTLAEKAYMSYDSGTPTRALIVAQLSTTFATLATRYQ